MYKIAAAEVVALWVTTIASSSALALASVGVGHFQNYFQLSFPTPIIFDLLIVGGGYNRHSLMKLSRIISMSCCC